MIGSLIETTLTSPVASFASLLTHLRPLRKLRFPARLILVYLWALTVNPCWPICFLHTFEYDFMLNTLKQDMTKAIQLSNTFRYIDDLLSVNNE